MGCERRADLEDAGGHLSDAELQPAVGLRVVCRRGGLHTAHPVKRHLGRLSDRAERRLTGLVQYQQRQVVPPDAPQRGYSLQLQLQPGTNMPTTGERQHLA